jgi:hypothetical protein
MAVVVRKFLRPTAAQSGARQPLEARICNRRPNLLLGRALTIFSNRIRTTIDVTVRSTSGLPRMAEGAWVNRML